MRCAVLLVCLTALACKETPETAIGFFAADQRVVEAPMSTWQKQVHAETVTVHEPYEIAEVTFRALPANAVLDAAYGPAWRQAQMLSLQALDGYVTTVPTSRFLEHKSWFAFARTDRDAFTLDKKVPKVETVQLGPAYLIWDSKNDPAMRVDGDYGWPYQLALIKTQTFAEAFPGLEPPEPVSPTALAGFHLFSRYCATCHALNGHGGKVGPELNQPHSVTEYWQPTWLRRWIDNPQQIRANTAMPGLPASVPNREQALDDILGYLRVMAGKK